MEKAAKGRQSNIELLRILAMMGIIIHHITLHCIFIQLTDVNSINQLGNAFFCTPQFYPELWLVDIGAFLGSVGDALFILISGYFLVEKETLHISKTTFKLVSQSLFAAFMVVTINLIYHRAGLSLNDTFLPGIEAMVGPVRTEFFNKSFWYIGYYYCIFIFAAVFLNAFLRKLTRQQYLAFVLALFGIIEFSFSRELISGISGNLSTFIIGVFLFSLGGYIKKYDPFSKIKTWLLPVLIILTFAGICYSTYYSRVLDIERYIRSNSDISYIQSTYVFGIYNILVIINVISVLELFSRIKIKTNRIINFLGSATFMCYLIHDNELFYALWNKYDWIKALCFSPIEYTCNLFSLSLITFLAGVIAFIVFQMINIFIGKIHSK